jgi:hypothetical protein
MPRLTREQWVEVRAKREAGASFPALAKEYGISHQAIQKRAKAAGWSDGSDVAHEIRRKAAARVAGVIESDPVKKAAAIESEAGRLAEVVDRHRQEWKIVTTLRAEALINRRDKPQLAFTKLKIAKITAELTQIQQTGERKAWGLDENVDVSKMTDQQLLDIINGKKPR